MKIQNEDATFWAIFLPDEDPLWDQDIKSRYLFNLYILKRQTKGPSLDKYLMGVPLYHMQNS